jgi:uncharacterized protein YjbI with pentapeptide repeats
MSDEVQRPTSDEDREGWKAYWTAQGMVWRTEPEIDEGRQRFLAKRREVQPDIEKGIYPFRDEDSGITLSCADVEWLLAVSKTPLDLRGAFMPHADFQYLSLSFARLGLTMSEYQTDTRFADLAAIHLQHGALQMVNLVGASLTAAHLEGCDLRGAALSNAYLEEAHLQGAQLEHAMLAMAYLPLAQLQEANLSFAHIEGADLRSARLDSANLTGALLQGAHLGGAVLARVMTHRPYQPTDFRGAGLDNVRAEHADLSNARLQGASLRNARLVGARLRGAHLEGADLTGANLEGADLTGATGL